eukprot:Pgem_evm1s14711
MSTNDVEMTDAINRIPDDYKEYLLQPLVMVDFDYFLAKASKKKLIRALGSEESEYKIGKVSKARKEATNTFEKLQAIYEKILDLEFQKVDDDDVLPLVRQYIQQCTSDKKQEFLSKLLQRAKEDKENGEYYDRLIR